MPEQMIKGCSRKRSVRTFLIAGILTIIGYFANMMALPVAFGVDFIFGTIFVIIAIRILGLRWGIGVAVAAASYTFILWNHPYPDAGHEW